MKRIFRMITALWPFYVLFIIMGSIVWLISHAAVPPKTPENYSTQTQTAPEHVTLTEKGKRIKAKYPAWTNEDCNTIGDRRINIGMTSKQVALAWGRPYKINTTVTANTRSEQWVMSDSINSSFLYFTDGVLTAIQQSKSESP